MKFAFVYIYHKFVHISQHCVCYSQAWSMTLSGTETFNSLKSRQHIQLLGALQFDLFAGKAYADTAHFLLIFSEAVTHAAQEQQFYLQVGLFLCCDHK